MTRQQASQVALICAGIAVLLLLAAHLAYWLGFWPGAD